MNRYRVSVAWLLLAALALPGGAPAGAEAADRPVTPDGAVNESVFVDGLARPRFQYSAPVAGGWSIVPSPNADARLNHLTQVACVSATDCWAVGAYSSNGSVYQTLVERWDGSSWTVIPSPNTSTTDFNILNDVTCVSASDCWAVGYAVAAGAYRTLIQRWDGSSWTIVTSPGTSPNTNRLDGIACVSASDCWAVGAYAVDGTARTLVEHWDGVSWSVVPSPNNRIVPTMEQDNALSGVTCVSASDCWAVGYYAAGVEFQTLIEHWDGHSWSVAASPNTVPVLRNVLNDVTCVSSSDCWAVGYHKTGDFYTSPTQSLVARWDGTSWSIVPSPNNSATQSHFLLRVTCAAPSDCWAVGNYGYARVGGGPRQTLIQHWDGTSWSIVPSPNTSAQTDNLVAGVACVSTSDCWAVGRANWLTLTMRYTR